MHRLSFGRRLNLILFFLVLASVLPARAEEPAIKNSDCLDCHSDFQVQDFESSSHGQNQCVSCHSDIKELPHQDSLKKADCSSCHAVEAKIYLASDHGKALAKGESAASCTDCHGHSHTIRSARDEASPIHRKNIHKTCAACHEDQEKMEKFNLLQKSPVASYAKTVHGHALMDKGVMNAATCTDCHGSHDLHAPTNPASKIHRSHIPETCGKCHENVLKTYEHSIHGRSAKSGKLDAPVCTDCHGEHSILSHSDPEAKIFAASVSEKVCAQCHAAERITSKYKLPADSVKTYLNSYHGLASKFGVATVANCASCHGAHDILPAADPDSSINPNNLAHTCGRCHSNAGPEFTKGSIHLTPSKTRDQGVYWVAVLYGIFIALVIGGMVFHNGIDFIKKWKTHYRQKQVEHHLKPRFTRSERLQHFVLLVSFFVLAYTGFALKFSDTWWASPFKVGSGVDWRGTVHRIAAAVFTLVAIYHLIYLAAFKRGREQIRALWFCKKDFQDLVGMIRFNLGVSNQRPKFGRYGYPEKAEYWALVWGSGIMIFTGAMLWAKDYFLGFWPKWALDVADVVHFYEATLATLAIFIWHFYFVIFDPDQYPMNLSMMTGKGEMPEEETPEKKEEPGKDAPPAV